MTWFKVDDSFHAHPKVLATDADAIGLWVVAGAWSSAHLTDGFVPDHALLRLLPGAEVLARKLVASGLWRRARGGHQFHDWSDFQPVAKEVRAMREKRAAAGRLGGMASGKTRSKPVSNSEANASAPAMRTVEPPARPDPSFSGGGSYVAQGGTRTSAPPARCKEHEDDPDPPACRRCRTAREAHEQWQADERRRLADAPRCPTHRGQLAHNCAPCRAERLGAE